MQPQDNEEQEILETFERGEWQSVPNLKQEKTRYQHSAAESLKKDKRINIRISSHDLEAIQFLAVEEGIPYQTLIASIIHKFASGKLVERSRQKHPGADFEQS